MFVGVIFLWVSAAWNTRDKIIGTLVVPGGYFTLLFLGYSSISLGECVQRTVRRANSVHTFCAEVPPSVLETVALTLLFTFLLVGPLASAIYLGYRLRRRPAATA